MKKRIYNIISNISEKFKKKDFSRSNKVLLFHSIETEIVKKDLYKLDKYSFENMIKFLLEINYNFVSFNEVFNNNNNLIVSFDDGFATVFDNALPILEKYNIPFHIFINKDLIKSNDNIYLCENRLIELSKKKNVTLGSHGVTHKKLKELSTKQIKKEIGESKIWLENIVDKKIDTFSYPHGSFDNRAKDFLEEYDYKYAATSKFGHVNKLTPKFEIPRLDIWSSDTNKVLNQKINGHWNWLNYLQSFKR